MLNYVWLAFLRYIIFINNKIYNFQKELHLFNYQFTLKYLSGKQMLVSDILSTIFVVNTQLDDNLMKMDTVQLATAEDDNLSIFWISRYNNECPS